jgi:hypothetical protein
MPRRDPEVHLTLYDSRNGDLALEVIEVQREDVLRAQRSNFFAIYWIGSGRGKF